jgi:spore coat polysaccharide biosynthesis protein SpsF
MKIIAAVQVRMGSTRLPGKVLAEVLDQPMLWHIVDRLRFAKLINEVVVATSNGAKDGPIRAFADKHGIPCFAGSELDVVDRLYRTARRFSADAIVRITGDCPLADPKIVDEVVETYLSDAKALDYVSNVLPRSYPDGLDTEVYPTKTLGRLCEEIADFPARESFPIYLWNNKQKFRIANVAFATDLSALRWTVDYEEDLTFVREVFRRLYRKGEFFSMPDVLELMEANPQLAAVNAKYAGSVGPPLPPRPGTKKVRLGELA